MSALLSEAGRRFLGEHRFGVLATINKDSTPQLSTVWYEMGGDEVLLNTAIGRIKERNLRRDPRCSICVEDGYRFVTIKGTATIDDDLAAGQEHIRHFCTLNHGEEEADRMMREIYQHQQRVIVRLRIERVVEYDV